MVKLQKSEWWLLGGLLLLSFVPSVGGILRFIELNFTTGFAFLPDNPRVDSAPLPVQFHLVTSVPYCILGAVQFLKSVRDQQPKWHRVSGRLLVVAGIVSALSGLWMTHFYQFPASLQGDLLYVVRLLVGVGMVVFIALGFRAVLDRRFSDHSAWMIRAYALGQGAGTQVFLTIPVAIVVGEPEGLLRDVVMTAAWIVNIAVAEWVILRMRQVPRRIS